MQTTYKTEHDNGLEGASVDCTLRRIGSALAEGVISAGLALTPGTNDGQRKLIGAGLAFAGVALHHIGITMDNATGVAQYQDETGMSFIEKGRVWVHVDGAVAVGDSAYALVAGDVGRFTKTVGSNIATGGKFITSTAGAGLAILEL